MSCLSTSFFAYCFIEIIPSGFEDSIVESTCPRSIFLRLFLIATVFNKSSKIQILVLVSVLFTSIWDWIPMRLSESLSAILCSIFVGKKDINLLKLWLAELVCKVLKTRCPLSARLRTVSAVSVSRISPTKMISGSSLITAFSAFLNDQVSCPTCLCEILHLSPSKIYSIGSSMVMMFSFLVLLIY